MCYGNKLGSAGSRVIKPVYDTKLWEGKCSIYCRAPSKESRQLVLKKSDSPVALRERFLKTTWEVYTFGGM